MSWQKCTSEEAQTYVNDGTAAIAVKGNEMHIVNGGTHGNHEIAAASSANNDTSATLAGQKDVQFYSYSESATKPSNTYNIYNDMYIYGLIVIFNFLEIRILEQLILTMKFHTLQND